MIIKIWYKKCFKLRGLAYQMEDSHKKFPNYQKSIFLLWLKRGVKKNLAYWAVNTIEKAIIIFK